MNARLRLSSALHWAVRLFTFLEAWASLPRVKEMDRTVLWRFGTALTGEEKRAFERLGIEFPENTKQEPIYRCPPLI